MIQAIFFDRDGVIGGDGHFTHPKNFRPYESAYKAFEILEATGIKKYSFTNQYRIALNQATLEDFIHEFESYGFDDYYICPHGKDVDCNCRKPKAGMLLQAAKDHNLDLKKCAVIGDVGTDLVAAHQVGALKVLVKTGFGQGALGDYKFLWEDIDADYIAEDILDAVKWILDKHKGDQDAKKRII